MGNIIPAVRRNKCHSPKFEEPIRGVWWGVLVPDLGAGSALNGAGELSILTNSKDSIPHLVHKTRRHYNTHTHTLLKIVFFSHKNDNYHPGQAKYPSL
jgi:hypothetical protein